MLVATRPPQRPKLLAGDFHGRLWQVNLTVTSSSMGSNQGTQSDSIYIAAWSEIGLQKVIQQAAF